MKKIEHIIFIIACIALCIIPFAGMTVANTDATLENRTLAAFPEWSIDGEWNQRYFEELGEYFEDHFAFRKYFVAVDSAIQSNIFQVSNTDTIIKGEDGWLYYEATLSDYLGDDLMSERAIFNAANNISLIQQYVEKHNAKFVLTVAPNKNSLYGNHMPYYADKRVSEDKNIENLEILLEKNNIHYVDLFDTFGQENEVLYMKTDSHWNNRGAALAYNTILNALEKEHESYVTTKNIRTKTAQGDLNRMLYPLGGNPDWDYQYEYESAYKYVTETNTVEDPWIETVCEGKEGRLLMYRDSFGNTLLPFMAEEYHKAYFSKAIPYAVEKDVADCQPDTVIIECVERNISQFATEAPIISGEKLEITPKETVDGKHSSMTCQTAEIDSSYVEVYGSIDETIVEEEDQIFVTFTNEDSVMSYQAFGVSNENTDYGYRLYVPAEELSTSDWKIQVMIGSADSAKVVLEKEIKSSDLGL